MAVIIMSEERSRDQVARSRSAGPVDTDLLGKLREFVGRVDKTAQERLGVSFTEMIREGSINKTLNYQVMLDKFIRKKETPEAFVSDLQRRYGLLSVEQAGGAAAAWRYNIGKAGIDEFICSDRRGAAWVSGSDGNGYTLRDGVMARMTVFADGEQCGWQIHMMPAPEGVGIQDVEANFPDISSGNISELAERGLEMRNGPDIGDCLRLLDAYVMRHRQKFEVENVRSLPGM